MLRYFFITLVSILFSLYLFEFYLPYKEKLSQEQLIKEQLLREKRYENQSGKKWDKRTTLQVYDDLKKTKNDIVVRFQPSYNLGKKKIPIFPLSGISNSDSIHCNENGYFTIYQSDRYGFNNPDEEWESEEIEYLLVGDSLTHGSCVNRPNDIASVLRTLSGKSTLNLGYGGNGPLIEYAVLREYSNSNIKKILWIYGESNDLFDLRVELKNKNLLEYLNSKNHSQNLRERQFEIDNLLKTNLKAELEKVIFKEELNVKSQIEKDNKLKYKILKFIRLDKTKKIFEKKNTNYDESVFQEFEKILRLSLKLSKENNAKLIFVYIPEFRRYSGTKYSDENYNKIVSIVKKLDIKLIDMKQFFDNQKNPKSFFPFGLFAWHYNIEGYRKIGEMIYQSTKD